MNILLTIIYYCDISKYTRAVQVQNLNDYCTLFMIETSHYFNGFYKCCYSLDVTIPSIQVKGSS